MSADDPIRRALSRAAAQGDTKAALRLGAQYEAAGDNAQALDCYIAAAVRGDRDAALAAGVLLLRCCKSPADGRSGINYLFDAAEQGSVAAMLHLAKHMLEGRWLPWNPTQLLRWVMKARARALPEALALDRLFGPAGDMQAHLCAWFELPRRLPVVLRHAPLLAYIDDALPAAACRLLCECARPLLTPALVYNARSGAREQDPTRNNSAAHLGPRTLCTLLVEWRLLKQVDPDLPLARAEEVSVLHYATGQQYHAHRDYLHPGQVDQFPPHGPGQRVRTAFAYLNQPLAGGETDFPSLGMRIAPVPGRVVVFDNVDATGAPDPSTLHAALPVLHGEKWLATLWLRESWAR